MRFCLVFAFLAVVGFGCGGTAVVEEGSGGAGGAGNGASSSSTTQASTSQSASSAVGTSASVSTGQTSGSGVDCDSLTAQYLTALDAASACNACQGFDACIGGPTLIDQCGCPIPLNGQTADLYNNAKELEATWEANGCGPFECGTPCQIGDTGFCQGGSGDCNGRCSY